MNHILVVDDERGSRESLKAIFSPKHRISLAENADEALVIMKKEKIDAILLDVIMPRKTGVELLHELYNLYPHIPVIMVSGSTEAQPIVDSIRGGAYDFVRKPYDIDDIKHVLERALHTSTMHRRLEVLESEKNIEYPERMIGESNAIKKAISDATQAAASDASVLVTGESGTGKELLARLIHRLSQRKDEPFVAVNCGGLPEPLMESELFGYEKGAFTGAEKRKVGRFDLAGNGSLFFDEVGEMTSATQVKLLRVLQEREFMRIGGASTIRTTARIIAATNRDLKVAIADKAFRDDLFYRLSVIPIHVPSLRERPEDIPSLVYHFMHMFNKNLPQSPREIEPAALDLMIAYPWPGNIRELRNIIERVLVLNKEASVILPHFLPEEMQPDSDKIFPDLEELGHLSLTDAVENFERQLVEDALLKANGVQTRAAEILGTTRRILRYRMEKLHHRYAGCCGG